MPLLWATAPASSVSDFERCVIPLLESTLYFLLISLTWKIFQDMEFCCYFLTFTISRTEFTTAWLPDISFIKHLYSLKNDMQNWQAKLTMFNQEKHSIGIKQTWEHLGPKQDIDSRPCDLVMTWTGNHHRTSTVHKELALNVASLESHPDTQSLLIPTSVDLCVQSHE